MKIDDGGPAFPGRVYESREFTLGMSLRDYFASAAGAKICSEVDMDDNWPLIAQRAYAFADAMLIARLKTPAPEEAP